MKFIADLHVHSKHSRATAKNLDLENLYIAGQLKGITVLGTGDVTHPVWFSEIKEKLVPAEAGLFKLREDIARVCNSFIPENCQGTIRFVLVSEISSIYKKNGKTRKNHNLVFFPDIESVEKFNKTPDKIGKIKSDGRPILGLDARNLLERPLEISSDSFLVPAHIWTPWFSMLGSKSGFDSIQREGICPVCSKPMTLGVLYRVEQLADRPLGARPQKHHPFHHIIPLNEILSELLGVGPNTKKVNKVFNDLLNGKGPELKILHELPIKSLYHGDVPLLGEAIKRVRNKEIHVFPGYDGVFGKIQIFTPREKDRLSGHTRAVYKNHWPKGNLFC